MTHFISQILIYKSNQLNSHRKAEKVRLCEYNPGGCDKNKTVQYHIPISIPSVPPTDSTSSSVCRVKYELQVNENKKENFPVAYFEHDHCFIKNQIV